MNRRLDDSAIRAQLAPSGQFTLDGQCHNAFVECCKRFGLNEKGQQAKQKLCNRVKKTMKKINIQSLIEILKSKRTNNQIVSYIPRNDQTIIIEKSVIHFQQYNKGMLVLMCGVGKTLISLWITQELNSNTILIGVPNKLLLEQWEKVISVLFQNIPCLTVSSGVDIEKIMNFLENNQRCIVITTYSSSHKVYTATKDKDFIFDMKILDEVHHLTTTNMRNSETTKKYIQMLNIQSIKQLSLTATLKTLESMYNVNDIIEEQTGNRPLSIGEDSRALICFPSDSNWRDCDPDNIVPAPSGGESYGLIGLLIMNDDESPDGTSYLGLRMWPTSISGKTKERIIDFSTSSVEIERKVAVGHPIGDIGYIKVKAEWRRNIAETPVDGWTIYLRGPPWELQRHTIYGTFYHLIQEGEQTTNYEDIKLKVNLTHDPLRAIFDGPIQWAYEEFGHFETYTLDGPPANCPPPE